MTVMYRWIDAERTAVAVTGTDFVRTVPADPSNIAFAEILAASVEIEDFIPELPPTTPTRVYKAPMFRKMTDAEYEAYLQIRAQFPPRLQAIFDAAEYLSSDDEFWPTLVAAAEQAYGAERAAELLAPTT